MSATVETREAEVERVLAWLYRDEVRHSRLIWRLEADRRLDPPWPYEGLWFDPTGAVVVDFRGHPTLGGAEPPWVQLDGIDLTAVELLCGVRLPMVCEALCPAELTRVLALLGEVETLGSLDVYVCAPGELGEAALPCEPLRLTSRHRALVEEADWRPEDFEDEIDEQQSGVRWAIVKDHHIVSRLLVQPVSRGIAEISDVYTRPDRRRRGYSGALVQHVTRRLHEHGLTATYSVHPSNTPSWALAQRVGYRLGFTWERVRLRRR